MIVSIKATCKQNNAPKVVAKPKAAPKTTRLSAIELCSLNDFQFDLALKFWCMAKFWSRPDIANRIIEKTVDAAENFFDSIHHDPIPYDAEKLIACVQKAEEIDWISGKVYCFIANLCADI